MPIDPKRISEFDPEEVPTVGQLLRELDSMVRGEDQDMEEHHSGLFNLTNRCNVLTHTWPADWENTSLKPYVEMLDEHVLRIMEQVRRVKRGTGKYVLVVAFSIMT